MHLSAIRLEPTDIELRKNLGLAYFNVGSYAEAIKAFTQALQINPDDASVHHCLGLVYLDLEDQESAMQQQKLIKELGHFELAVSLLEEIDRQFLRRAGGTAAKRPSPADSMSEERLTGNS
jgi:Flp pilus assembly protein TadD